MFLGSQPLTALADSVRCVSQQNLESVNAQGSTGSYIFVNVSVHAEGPGRLAAHARMFKLRMLRSMAFVRRLVQDNGQLGAWSQQHVVPAALTRACTVVCALQGRFYNDTRDPSHEDLSKPIRDMCQRHNVVPVHMSLKLGSRTMVYRAAADVAAEAAAEDAPDADAAAPLPSAHAMQEACFVDLCCAVSNTPLYLYCHLGCCEHMISVSIGMKDTRHATHARHTLRQAHTHADTGTHAHTRSPSTLQNRQVGSSTTHVCVCVCHRSVTFAVCTPTTHPSAPPTPSVSSTRTAPASRAAAATCAIWRTPHASCTTTRSRCKTRAFSVQGVWTCCTLRACLRGPRRTRWPHTWRSMQRVAVHTSGSMQRALAYSRAQALKGWRTFRQRRC